LEDIASVYKESGDYDKSLEYYDKAFVLLQKIQDDRGKSNLIQIVEKLFQEIDERIEKSDELEKIVKELKEKFNM
ncbi:MAG: hypothetical protein ACTSVY_01800, partial [Candidatus Helarchaeota archaeon]